MTTAPRRFCNPILPGFYPDPSICRVGDDYYLIPNVSRTWPAPHSSDGGSST